MAKFVEMKLEKGDAFAKKLGRLAMKSPNLLGQAMQTSAWSKLRPAAQQRVRQQRNVFRGELRQKIAVRSLTKKEYLPTIEFGSLGVPYGLDVEQGSRPRSVRASELTKLIDYAKKKMGRSDDEAERLAAAIAKTIETSGTRPHPFIMPTWEAKKDIFWADVLARYEANIKKI
tara:strand:- start:214 stop:732 length:519 start_codon:yes stop_codon:yes gene_type:complete